MKKLYLLFLRYFNLFRNKIYLLLRITPKVKDTIDTLDYILRHRPSVSRYGDGELLIIEGWYIGFQAQDRSLALRLKEILKSNQKNHIVCLPDVFGDLNCYTDTAANFWKAHLHGSLYKWCKSVKMDKQYYNTQITRFYMDVKDKHISGVFVEKLRLIWDARDIVIVEGEKSRMGFKNDLFSNAHSVKRILCPAENAFSAYDMILRTILHKVAVDELVLIALGPTATVLAYDLCLNGYQAIDLGHLDVEYEWYKKGVTVKCAIEGKYVNEVNATEVNDTTDENYQSQILAIVK